MSEQNMQHPETPIIIIERDDEQNVNAPVVTTPTVSRRKKWLQWIAGMMAILAALLLVLVAYNSWKYYYRIGIPVSVSPSENIEKLKTPAPQEPAEVVMTNDSVLGVALDFYAIHGLRASIEFHEPDTADTSVFLYCRSADHTADGNYIGSLVAEGKEMRTDRSRLGYMAMTNDNMVIGISRSDKVKDYVKDHGGSFFRQFILVSNGVIPTRFHLHGKVERNAIGRIGDQLYYITTRHKETLYDFADALREYGFTDAIYITGGDDYSFYRTRDGQRHDIGNVDDYPHKKWKDIIPWVVFRK